MKIQEVNLKAMSATRLSMIQYERSVILKIHTKVEVEILDGIIQRESDVCFRIMDSEIEEMNISYFDNSPFKVYSRKEINNTLSKFHAVITKKYNIKFK